MQLLIVTVAEAQQHLPELIARVAAGDQVVIAEGGKSVATLRRPPLFPTTPEEIEATRPTREEAVREMVRDAIAAGHGPPADSKVWELFPEGERPKP
jgi:antitoxin (DNA-binding transcriptional repressor) of toxin-antitoxin stability system